MSPELLSSLKTLCRCQGDYAFTGTHWNLYLEPGRLLEAVRRLDAQGYHIEDVSGLDMEEGFEVVYHFARFEANSRVTLRVNVPHEEPVVPSITSVFVGADWHERETFDMYGIRFDGHPNLLPLLLPEDLGLHPLVKEPGKRMSAYVLFPHYQMIDNCGPYVYPAAESGPEGAAEDDDADADS